MDFSIKGKVVKEMIGYLREINVEFHRKIKKAKTSARENLFTVDKTSGKLGNAKKGHFYYIIAGLLFVVKRTCPNISTAIVFLTTKVRELIYQDWSKLERLIRYIDRSLGLVLTLEASNTIITKW